MGSMLFGGMDMVTQLSLENASLNLREDGMLGRAAILALT